MNCKNGLIINGIIAEKRDYFIKYYIWLFLNYRDKHDYIML